MHTYLIIAVFFVFSAKVMPYGILCKGITPQDSMRIPIMAAPRISPFRVVVYITTLKDIPHHYRIFFCFFREREDCARRRYGLQPTGNALAGRTKKRQAPGLWCLPLLVSGVGSSPDRRRQATIRTFDCYHTNFRLQSYGHDDVSAASHPNTVDTTRKAV